MCIISFNAHWGEREIASTSCDPLVNGQVHACPEIASLLSVSFYFFNTHAHSPAEPTSPKLNPQATQGMLL